MSAIREPGIFADTSRLIRTALLIVAGLFFVSPSTAHAQKDSEEGKLRAAPIYEGYMEVRLSGDAEPGTLIITKEFEKFLGKTIQVHHEAITVGSERYVLRTLLVTPSGKTIGQCTSETAELTPGELMVFPEICSDGSLTEALHEAGVETLTIEKALWVEGKPVNMGLWARENLDKSSLALSIVVTPETARDGEIAPGGLLVMTLKYPIEHGIVS